MDLRRTGAEIAGTKGTATPMPAATTDWLIRLWASPQGAAKAAVAGTSSDTFWLGANPGTLLVPDSHRAGRNRDRNTRFEVMTESVTVKLGSATTQFT